MQLAKQQRDALIERRADGYCVTGTEWTDVCAGGKFAVSSLYSAILAGIESHDYDTFRRRAHVPLRRKMTHMPGMF